MYRLRLISPIFGVDEAGPFHPTQQDAHLAALRMLKLYREGELMVEVRKVTNFQWHRSEIIETLGSLKPRSR